MDTVNFGKILVSGEGYNRGRGGYMYLKKDSVQFGRIQEILKDIVKLGKKQVSREG
jgi:hypothetical protein